MALFANSPRCNGASAAEGRPSVARLASSRQPVTRSRHMALYLVPLCAEDLLSSLNGRSINAHGIRDQFPFYVVSDKNNHAPKSGCRLVVVFQ